MRLKITIFKGRNSVCRVAKIFKSFYVGGDTIENYHFQKRKQRLQGYKKFFQLFYVGGDATKNYDFQREKQRLQGSFFLKGILSLGQGCEKIETDP